MYKVSLVIGAAAILAVVFIAVIVVKLRPLMWLAFRGPRRRPVESGLASLGIALGTSLTVGALILAASIESSVAGMKDNRLGPVDVIFTFEGSNAGSQASKIAEALPPAGVDGSLLVDRAEASLGVPSAESAAPPVRAEPDVVLLDFEFGDAARLAGSDESGLPSTGPSGDTVYISSALAKLLSVRVGDDVLVGLPRGRYGFKVAQILDARSLAGIGGSLDKPAQTVWVPRGWLQGHQHQTQLLVSLSSGPGSLDERSQTLLQSLSGALSTLSPPRPSVSKAGAEIDLTAQNVGALMRRQLLQLGSFAGAASLALVIAIFAMIVADRRREIGILRANGMKRLHAAAEMGQEAVELGVVGAALGVGLGLLVAAAAASTSAATLNSVVGGVDFKIVTSAEGIAVGAGGAFLAGIVAAIGGTRRWLSMPPAAALRSEEEQGRPVRVAHLVLGIVAIAFGIATAATDLKNRTSTFAYLGPPIAMAGLATVLYQTQWAYVAMLIAAIASGLWLIGIDVRWGGQAASEGVFVTFGMALALVIAGSVAFGVLAPMTARGITRLMNIMRARSVTARLAAANLASSRGNAGFTVATCALVVLMPASIATVSSMERSDRARLLSNQSGGWTAMIESRAADEAGLDFAGRIKSGALGSQFSEIAELPKSRSAVHLIGAGSASASFYATSRAVALAEVKPGGNESGAMLPLVARAQDLHDDSAAWASLFESHSDGAPRVVVTSGLLPRGVDLRGAPLRVGDSGRIVKVAGVAHRNAFMPGIFIAPEALGSLGLTVDRRNALALVPANVDPEKLALDFQGLYFGEGARMSTAADAVARQLQARTLLAQLLQSFLSIGLVVGVASLAVVIARSVRSRRHEIAVLRAMGVSRTRVGLSVIGQSLGLTVSGVGMGVILGGYIGGRVFLAMSAGGSAAAPWGTLLGVFALVVCVTTIGAVIPAIAASRMSPADALRDAAA